MDEDIKKDIYAKRCQLGIKALKNNGFDAVYADNSKEALKKALSMIPKEATVGISGTVTIREIGLVDALEKQGNTIYTDWKHGLEKKEKLRIRRAGMNSDVYLTSSNAITLKGQLVNIDGTGNRVAAMIFGPKKTIIIAGANKIVDNLDDAFARIRNIACPLNGRRLSLNVPCATAGKCTDCNSPQRMCKVSVVIDKKPNLSDITIILVGENLGY
jgi:L-lactate utilization protein LutB